MHCIQDRLEVKTRKLVNPDMHSTALATAAAGLVMTRHCTHVRCCSDDIGQSLTPEQQHKGA
jgi:hypothetical protein